jgi:hypothetical protein
MGMANWMKKNVWKLESFLPENQKQAHSPHISPKKLKKQNPLVRVRIASVASVVTNLSEKGKIVNHETRVDGSNIFYISQHYPQSNGIQTASRIA